MTSDFGGMPFIDPLFRPKRLLAAVLAARCHALGILDYARMNAARFLLAPSSRQILGLHQGATIHFTDLSIDALMAVRTALAAITDRIPSWNSLLRLPVHFARITTPGVISCSSPAYPQHIFLADCAFTTDDELREQVLHEFCHNWLYLLQEVTTLSTAPASKWFILPSGTGNRTAEELFGAAHVAATLSIFYSAHDHTRSGVTNQVPAMRLTLLLPYLEKCLVQLRALEVESSLTCGGEQLLKRLVLVYNTLARAEICLP